MLGYVVLLCLARSLSWAIAAAVLAADASWQVKPLPDDTVHAGMPTAEDGVLGYAPAPYVPPLLDRWPVLLAPAAILAGAIPIAAVASLPWIVASRNPLYEWIAWTFFVPPIVAVRCIFLAAWLAAQRPATDCSRKDGCRGMGTAADAQGDRASAAVLLFVAGVVDWKARQKIAEMARRRARVAAIARRTLPDDRNARMLLYGKAKKTRDAGTPIRWTISPAGTEDAATTVPARSASDAGTGQCRRCHGT